MTDVRGLFTEFDKQSAGPSANINQCTMKMWHDWWSFRIQAETADLKLELYCILVVSAEYIYLCVCVHSFIIANQLYCKFGCNKQKLIFTICEKQDSSVIIGACKYSKYPSHVTHLNLPAIISTNIHRWVIISIIKPHSSKDKPQREEESNP